MPNPIGGPIPGGASPTTGVAGTTAVPSTPAPAAPVASAPETTIAPGLAPSAPSAASAAPGAIIAEMAKAETKYKVVDLIKTPTTKTSLSAKYNLGGYSGRMLSPGEQILLELPPELRGKPVRTVILRHRQDAAHDTGTKPGEKWDAHPGLTAVHLHATDLPAGQSWRHWNGPWGSSGAEGAKFAEQRPAGDPENEIEFDWHVQGHSGVDGGGSTKKKLFADAVRIRCVGDAANNDPVFVHMVEVQMLPPKPDKYEQATFSEGTVIGDPETGAGKKFTGGQGYKGKFPGALELSGGGAGVGKLPEGWKFVGGRLEVSLPAGMKITGVDVACGDSFPDEKQNKDGGWGTPGWAKMHMSLQKAGGAADTFMSDQGVPPEGILSGAPTDPDYVTKAGDKFILRGSGSTLYVMALRIGLKAPE